MAAESISDREAEVYDRQIRVWGVDAQLKLRRSIILIVGLSSMGVEIAKNLILAGAHVILEDSTKVSQNDSDHCFAYRSSHVGMTRAFAAQETLASLNPLVNVETTQSALAFIEQSSHVQSTDSRLRCVIAANTSKENRIALANACATAEVAYYAAVSAGLFSACFCDPGRHHEYTYKISSTGENVISVVDGVRFEDCSRALTHVPHTTMNSKKAKQYSLWTVVHPWLHSDDISNEHTFLQKVLNVCKDLKLPETFIDTEAIKHIVHCKGYELPAVNSAIGGIISQELIKVVSSIDEPLVGYFAFDGRTGAGQFYNALGPLQAKTEEFKSNDVAIEL